MFPGPPRVRGQSWGSELPGPPGPRTYVHTLLLPAPQPRSPTPMPHCPTPSTRMDGVQCPNRPPLPRPPGSPLGPAHLHCPPAAGQSPPLVPAESLPPSEDSALQHPIPLSRQREEDAKDWGEGQGYKNHLPGPGEAGPLPLLKLHTFPPQGLQFSSPTPHPHPKFKLGSELLSRELQEVGGRADTIFQLPCVGWGQFTPEPFWGCGGSEETALGSLDYSLGAAFLNVSPAVGVPRAAVISSELGVQPRARGPAQSPLPNPPNISQAPTLLHQVLAV